MYFTDEILDKLNRNSAAKNTDHKAGVRAEEQITLPDIMVRSFAEVKALAGNKLTWGEKNFLYQQAQKGYKENKIAESHILSRANPQLANAVRLGIRQSSLIQGYDDLFLQRSGKFTRPGSVASMFSPAAYLTELYREARKLHPDTSQYSLDKRRADLASIMLSQENMDEEISTLSLSNELILNNLQQSEELTYDGVMEKLSTWRQTGQTPYNHPYEAVRQSILLQDKNFSAFNQNPEVAKLLNPTLLLGIVSDISPELYQVIIEPIEEENADDLIKKNFGDMDPTVLQNRAALAQYYDIPVDVLQSLLSIVGIDNGSSNRVQHYVNDQLIALTEDDEGNINVVLIKRRPGNRHDNEINYAELIPQGGNNYLFNFSLKERHGSYPTLQLGTKGKKSNDLLEKENYIPEKNSPQSFEIQLPDVASGEKIEITVSRSNSTADAYYDGTIFTIINYDFNVFLLKLNKIIRLYKATGIAPDDIQSIIETTSGGDKITDQSLSALFYIYYYSMHYDIEVNQAIILSGGIISQTERSNKPSLFTRLFNQPPLNGQTFSADNTTELDLQPDTGSDTFIAGVLKRAFQVNDSELYTLWKLARGNEGNSVAAFTCSIDNLTSLYRVRLLAEVHNLTVTELDRLLSLSPYAGQSIATLSDSALSGLVSFIALYTQWLEKQNLAATDLFLMLTSRYSTAISPEIENLIATLKNGLPEDEQVKNTAKSADQKETLFSDMAPFIAAAMQLDSAEAANTLLLWLDQLQPAGLTVEDFLSQVYGYAPDKENASLVAFCQVLAQLALIVRTLGLSESELSLAVTQPHLFQSGATVLPHNLQTLYSLSGFHQWLMQCGKPASEVMTALKKGSLTPEQLAQAMNLDNSLVAQGLEQSASGATVFSSWLEVDSALQWVNVATTLGITPAGLARLVNLTYTDPENYPTWDDWTSISHMLQGGLSPQQTSQLQAALDEASSAAICAYYLRMITVSWVNDRNSLYSYLLIDNQVSAQVKTTRLAEAIASLQLYVNRAMNGMEDNVNSSMLAEAFFIDWDRYNKRYSTWAGVSLLAYYPENYIDPTIRLGQTQMMGDLLQQLSQNQLNSDTVEDGVWQYLTAFDDIANLTVLNGYHDRIDSEDGYTWFVGCGQTEPKEYYWRNVNHSLFKDGQYPANAWSEWKLIGGGMNVYANYIRPVIHNSRLYVLWIEEKKIEISDSTAGSNSDTVTEIVTYALKYAHIRYDGNWSTPSSIDVTEVFKGDKNPGFYCSSFSADNSLAVIFYPVANEYNTIVTLPDESVLPAAWTIYQNMTSKQCDPDTTLYLYNSTYNQFNTTEEKLGKINTLIAGSFTSNVITEEQDDADMFAQSVDIDNILLWEKSADLFEGKFTPTFRVALADNKDKPGSLSEAEQVLLDTVTMEYAQTYFYEDSTLIDNYSQLRIPDSGFIVNYNNPEDLGNDDDNVISVMIKLPVEKAQDIPSTLSDYNLYIGFTESDSDSEIDSLILLLNENSRATVSHFEQGTFLNIMLDLKSYREIMDSENEPFIAAMTHLVEKKSIGIQLLVSGAHLEYSLITDGVSKFKGRTTKIDPKDLLLRSTSPEHLGLAISALEGCAQLPSLKNNELVYKFEPISFSLTSEDFDDNKASVSFSAIMGAISSLNFTLTFQRRLLEEEDVITLHTTSEDVQYLQHDVYRTRLNTLFARELIARASASLDAVLAMETQRIPEPQLGKGFYVNFTLPPYDAEVHGSSPAFTINLADVVSADPRVIYAGTLTSVPSDVTLFIPLDETPLYTDVAKIFLQTELLNTSNPSGIFFIEENNRYVIKEGSHVSDFQGVEILYNRSTDPMDFNGANAIYFWELFYYTPMMVFQRLLQEQNFTEATRWMQYIWNPAGYIVDGDLQEYHWNVRPLEEDTSWNTSPLDSVDPDAVAQNDPMHYKLATFMRALDLLIARGDAAYRRLERDTLNEAKMWYTQALHLLGDEPLQSQNIGWTDPRLSEAADDTLRVNAHRALLTVRGQTGTYAPRSANSLTGLFLPQQNEKLQGYWQTLAQRLYNLRHNLSIDGQPLLLPIFAAPADPAALLSAAVNAAQGGRDLPEAMMPLFRFPVMLENARGMVSQLMQFGSTLLNITERQDAEALSELLQTQGSELVRQGIAIQQQALAEVDADKSALEETRKGVQSRFESYSSLYEENVNNSEQKAMDLYTASSSLALGAKIPAMGGAMADMAPNIFGLADGGSKWGAVGTATAETIQTAAEAMRVDADRISQSEMYRRRRQEWEIQRNAAESELKQIDAQLETLAVRREAAVLQITYQETQQAQTLAQLTYLQNKFTSKALYNWLRGKLAAIYYQFYDLTVSRCLMAQEAYKWALGVSSATFIRPGAWQGTYAGLMAGETLMLSLAQMEQSYLQKDQREKEVTRTVCLSEVYANLSGEGAFSLEEKITALVTGGKGSAGTAENGLAVTDNQLQVTLKLSDLNIKDDYPTSLGQLRRIRQISVTLPALTGPYQDVRAVLSYGGSVVMPRGCESLAVSHGMNDSGQFQLDFNDARWLPFEGIPVDDGGTLTLSFPDVDSKQKDLLLSLTDIILHIRYTIVN